MSAQDVCCYVVPRTSGPAFPVVEPISIKNAITLAIPTLGVVGVCDCLSGSHVIGEMRLLCHNLRRSIHLAFCLGSFLKCQPLTHKHVFSKQVAAAIPQI